jgi:hypothetical protein
VDEVAPRSHPLLEERRVRALHQLVASDAIVADTAAHVLQPLPRLRQHLAGLEAIAVGIAKGEEAYAGSLLKRLGRYPELAEMTVRGAP